MIQLNNNHGNSVGSCKQAERIGGIKVMERLMLHLRSIELEAKEFTDASMYAGAGFAISNVVAEIQRIAIAMKLEADDEL